MILLNQRQVESVVSFAAISVSLFINGCFMLYEIIYLMKGPEREPGKYCITEPVAICSMIHKSCMLVTKRRDYARVIICGAFVIALVLFSTIVGSCLLYMSNHAIADMTSLIMEVEKEYLLPYVLLLFLMLLILLGYIRKRSDDYGVLLVLGLKKKHCYRFIAFEYFGIIIGSIMCGGAFGALAGEAARRVLKHIFAVPRLPYGTCPFKLTIIISVILFSIGFVFCDQLISCMGMEYVVAMGKKGGRAIKNSRIMIIIGFALWGLTAISVVTYWGKIGYTVPVVFLSASAILLMLFLGGAVFSRGKAQQKTYYKKMLWQNDWHHQFYYHMNQSYILAAFIIILLFCFNLILIDNVPVTQKENYPYDLVWGANTADEEFLSDLERSYGVKLTKIPSMRVVSANYGEHMGICESKFEKLTGEQVQLKRKEIYVIYQKDRSEYGTVGLDSGRKKPRLYIGASEWDIWIPSIKLLPSNKFTDAYTIAGERNQIITGNFKTRVLSDSGIQDNIFENIIVFNDQEYNAIHNKAQGSDLCVLMHIPEHYDQVVNKVYEYAKENSQVNFFDYKEGNLIYERKQLMYEDRERKMLNVSAMLINMFTLAACVIFVILETAGNEYEEIEWKYLFYYRSGMPGKTIRKCLYKEVAMTTRIALISSLSLSIPVITIKVLYKQMNMDWNRIYFFEIFGIVLLIIILLELVLFVLKRTTFARIERRYADE